MNTQNPTHNTIYDIANESISQEKSIIAEHDSSRPLIVIDPSQSKPTLALMNSIEKIPAENKSKSTAKNAKIARAAETEDQYRYRVKILQRLSTAKRTVDPQYPATPSPIEIVNDLISSATPKDGKKPERTYASWSLYRSALLWDLAPKKHINASYEAAYQLLTRTKYPSSKKITALPLKVTYADNDFAKLIDTLQGMEQYRSYWGVKTAYWLQAGVACGARSAEWMDTQWQNKEDLQLIIPNIKRKNDTPAFFRGNDKSSYATENTTSLNIDSVTIIDDYSAEEEFDEGQFDTVDDLIEDKFASHRVIKIDPNDAIYIDIHMQSLAEFIEKATQDGRKTRKQAFNMYYVMAVKTLRKACDIAFKGKKYYRLYNTRSQFAANQKVFHELGAVAAMMGHTNNRTTMRYGSRAGGIKGKNTFANKNILGEAQKSADIASIEATFNSLEGIENTPPTSLDTGSTTI